MEKVIVKTRDRNVTVELENFNDISINLKVSGADNALLSLSDVANLIKELANIISRY